MASRRDYHKESPVTVRLPAPVLQRLDKRAEETGVSRSALIIEAVTEKLERETVA